MHIVSIDNEPFYSLQYRCSGPRGKSILTQKLPFFRAKVDRLPPGVDAMVLTSDLQGREHDPRNRLLGVRVAEELAQMVQNKMIPQAPIALLAGDLFDYPEMNKRSGCGEVIDVWTAFAEQFDHVLGVHGNHDFIKQPKALPSNAAIVDGYVSSTLGLRIGGVSGITGKPTKNQRRTEEDFFSSLDKVVFQNPDILVLHQGPDDPADGRRRGDSSVRENLEFGYSGLTVFGHCYWPDPFVMPLGQGQVVNVDSRVIIVEQA
jgi:Icc-related predicted phosphoesterase